ncbi:S24 family peptidase [Rhizobium lentis]|uniref:LexA family protein n=1 Tax=Rhizobium lentis TaxID=1138194 RepID=UPI001C832A92|nr:S24 family peptidase [Rhizobium lentis]MBX5143359.1 S24 family peptidase [Rhizobium lentis]
MTKKIEIESNWPKWKVDLATRINDLGLSMKSASLQAKLNETWVRDTLKRDKTPSVENLAKIKAALKIADTSTVAPADITSLKVLGRAQAGAFMDVSVIDDDVEHEVIPVARNPRFPHAEQYALRVVGDSMNKHFDDGSYVTCVSWPDTGLQLRPGLCLHVERYRGPLVEVTLKMLDLAENGHLCLFPSSTNPVHKPIELNGDEGTEIVVRGLVTGFWKPVEF